MIRTKRVYVSPGPEDGSRVLVDRLWPRGIGKKDLSLDLWQKDVAPSSQLRKWFRHAPERWAEFKSRYFGELDNNAAAWKPLADLARNGDVTLLYSAKDEEHNNAQALREYLESELQK